MAIIHVTALKDLRKRLDSLEWQLPEILNAIQFSYYDGSRHNYCKLKVAETKLLTAVLQSSDSVRCDFLKAAGGVLKEIVLQRCDIAIIMAAKEARAEAQSVLDALKECNETPSNN